MEISRPLPELNDLTILDAPDRDLLLARLIEQRRRRTRANVEASLALPDIADWIEANCYDADRVRNPERPQDSPKIHLTAMQKRILRHCFTINPRTGRFPYRTVVYSAPKKSGKSAIGGMISAWYAACVEAPNAIFILANDREQSTARVYKAARPSLFGIGGVKDGRYRINLPNGTYVQASTNDPGKEAGGTYGLTVWDELWAFTTPRDQSLWAELRPVPTRVNSVRLVATYAGYEDASDLLFGIYKTIFTDSTERLLAPGAAAVPELLNIVTTDSTGAVIPCCYEATEIGLFYFNDHEQRMPWQQGEHGEALMRESSLGETETDTYRLNFNRWQKTQNRFLGMEALQASFARFKVEPLPKFIPMTMAIDAGWMHDNSALCGVFPGADDKYITAYARAWIPDAKDGGLDLDATITAEVLRLYKAGMIAYREPSAGERLLAAKENLRCVDVWYDATQMHQVAMRLRKKHKLLLAPFDQKKLRLLSDSFLREAYNKNGIDNLPSAVLESHLDAARSESQLNANAVGLTRIVKAVGKYSKPIDLAVAQSMAVYKCSSRTPPVLSAGIISTGVKGWTRK